MMEVEDRHLNVMIDLINTLVPNGPSLSYLSEQFSAIDMVYKLSQMIAMYDNNVFAHSSYSWDPMVPTDGNRDVYCMTACTAIKYWLLDYYKHDFVTINGRRVADGCEEEIVLTSLMVLRVVYQMRQLLDESTQQILTDGWKDLQEFDQQLDEKFETKCLKLMSLLVSHSTSHRLIVDSFDKQMNDLKDENQWLRQQLGMTDEKSVNQLFFNNLALKKIPTNGFQSNDTIASNDKLLAKSTLKLDSKTAKQSINAAINDIKPMGHSLQSQTRVKSELKSPVTRRSARKVSVKQTDWVKTSPKVIFKEIRAIFSESDDSDDFEYFDGQQIDSHNRSSAQSPSHSIDLTPIRTRFTNRLMADMLRSTQSGPTLMNGNQTMTTKANTTKWWPSRNKSYPRKKRYPCNWTDCHYIADRPSTLTRHQRRHTGEKPFQCDWPGCTKRYKMSSNLTPHKLTHTGIKPYGCDECPKRFTYPQHLKRHQLSSH